MKKKGKRYRKIQKEKELKRCHNISDMPQNISEEVNEINLSFLSMAHIVIKNPIINDSENTKKEYLKKLNSYLKAGGWNRRKYEYAELCAYEKIILESEKILEKHELDFYQKYILFDLLHIIGYEIQVVSQSKIQAVMKKYYKDFPKMTDKKDIVARIFKSVQGTSKGLRQLEQDPIFKQEKEYIQIIRKNLEFKKKSPFRVLVTATMSAGKSTFINAITGKYVCLSQNMACTSKIHCIVNKAFEDGYSYEYDHDLILTAGREELLNDNEMNLSDKIVVSTYFNSTLGNKRIIINDSPGVNFSGDKEHKRITDKLIKSRNYNLVIYLMNATQLATNDEEDHLNFVKKTIGKTPIFFVINKIDTFHIEEENIEQTVKNLKEYLKKRGFKNPIVFPISSKAGYLAKRFEAETLSRSETRELYNYIDKFEKMNLICYYKNNFKNIKIKDAETEEAQLLKTSGLAYLEKWIEILMEEMQMAQIYVRYNPYRMETEIKVNGNSIAQDSMLYKVVKGKRMQEWIEKFPQMLVEELNTVDFDMKFYGMALDWDDFEEVFNHAKTTGIIKRLSMQFIEAESDEDITKRIVEVFTDLQDGPIDDFRDPKLIRAFENVNNCVFPINVIATMSSGKSTIINALLGKRLMPSKNEACTATITEILDNDMEQFVAVAYDENDVVLQSISDLTYNVMNQLNDNPNVHRIAAEGNIPFLDTNSNVLMLVDTPGPNNSQNQAHKNTTYRAINSNSNNLILYVLNGTQLSTNDDAELLSYVAKQIKKGGKQVRDRFLFVINKMDGFNPEEEDISKVIQAAKTYLASHGIEDPQIFPCSAYTALNIRTYLNDIDIDHITRSEERKLPSAARDTLPMIDKFIGYNSMHLEQYSTLSPTAKRELDYKLNQAEQNEDTKEQALIHCGIYSIEAAIKAYVKKYARTKKVKDLVECFQEVLESTQVLTKAKTQVATDEEAAKTCAERAAAVRAKISDGKEAEIFKERIIALNPMKVIEEKAERLKAEATRKTGRVFAPYGDAIRNKEEAKRLVTQFTIMSSDYIAELTAELENVINKEVMQTGERILIEYQEKLEKIDQSATDKQLDFSTVDLIKGALNNMKENAERWCSDDFAVQTVDTVGEVTYEEKVYYEKVGQEEEEVADGTEKVKIGTRKVKVGSHREKIGNKTVRNPDAMGFKGFFRRVFQGEQKYIEEAVYKNVDDYKEEDVYETVIKYKTVMKDIYQEHREQVEKFFVETAVIQTGLVSKLRKNLDDGIEDALNYAEDQISRMKMQFTKMFDELDAFIQQKYTELEQCANDQQTKEAELKKNKKILNWIETCQAEIDEILNI